MTIIAGDGLVRAVQGEVRGDIVIECCYLPRLTAVARATVVTAMPFVVIVFEVATDTSHVHDISKRIFTVAVGAGQSRVLELQWEVRVVAVVETGVVPGAGIVAVFTLLAATPLM